MDLVLEPRGMNFYKGCPEKKSCVDFSNFRYFAEIEDGAEGNYYAEITIHWRDSFKRVNAFIEFSYKNREGLCHKVGLSITEPTKEAVLQAVNYNLKTNFDNLTIKGE